jgi:hypothetical protein
VFIYKKIIKILIYLLTIILAKNEMPPANILVAFTMDFGNRTPYKPKVTRYFEFPEFVAPSYFLSRLDHELEPYDCRAEGSRDRLKNFFFIDTRNAEVLVETENDYAVFMVWVRAMIAAGKALDVQVKIYI